MKGRLGVAVRFSVVFCFWPNSQAWRTWKIKVLKKVIQGTLFFSRRISSCTIAQFRRDSVWRWEAGLTGPPDTSSAMAADVQAKYQGFLITEVRLNIEGLELAPGQTDLDFQKMENS